MQGLYPPKPPAASKPCWGCEHFAGLAGPGNAVAACRRDAPAIGARSMPEKGCAFWTTATTRAPMRLLVCGGRDYQDRQFVFDSLDKILAKRVVTLVIHGACQGRDGKLRGADRWADEWAEERLIERLPCPADWGQHGLKAGPLRNAHMLTLQPDGVVAFPGGRGTDGMATLAIQAGVPVWRPNCGAQTPKHPRT